jgi:hypothetical protein
MLLKLESSTMPNIPWHDAEIDQVNLTISSDGGNVISISLEINPEESLDALRKFGIKNRKLFVNYNGVWRYISDVRGDSVPREVVIDYEEKEDSPLISEIKAAGMAVGVDLRHHQIHFSAGTKLDIIFEMAYISQED